MIQDFSLVPRTGRKTALFFNGLYRNRVEFALKRDIPGQYELYGRKDGFEAHLPDGCTVPEFVPIAPGAENLRARVVTMLVTDMEPDGTYACIKGIIENRDDDVFAAFSDDNAPDPGRMEFEINRWEAARSESR